jgi:hypothetical protein
MLHATYMLRPHRADPALFAVEVQLHGIGALEVAQPGRTLLVTQYSPARHDGGGTLQERELPLLGGEDEVFFTALCWRGDRPRPLHFGITAWDGAELVGTIACFLTSDGALETFDGSGLLGELRFAPLEEEQIGELPPLPGDAEAAGRGTVVFVETFDGDLVGLVICWHRRAGDEYCLLRYWRSRAHADRLFYAQVALGARDDLFPLTASGAYWVAPDLEVRCQSVAVFAPELAEMYDMANLLQWQRTSGARLSKCLYCSRCNDFLPIGERFTSVDAQRVRRACPHIAYCPLHQRWETPETGACPATLSAEDPAALFALFRSTILQCEVALAAIHSYDLYHKGRDGLWTIEGYQVSSSLRVMIRHARNSIEDAFARALLAGAEAGIVFWGKALAWCDRGRIPPYWDSALVSGAQARRERARLRFTDFLPSEVEQATIAQEHMDLALGVYLESYSAAPTEETPR